MVDWVASALFVLVAFPAAVLSRLARRKIDVGIGPEPLINNVYHKKALELQGYSVETFVDQVYFITSEFDYRADKAIPRPLYFLRGPWLFLRALFRYRALYIYFNGGPLMYRPIVWRLEPLLYRAAGVRVVVMPYGGDVQDLTRSPNLRFKHAMSIDYPSFKSRRKRIDVLIDLWTRHASHVISGCEWVDYMYQWDTLMLAHFSIDTGRWHDEDRVLGGGPLHVLHAPNHRAVKGTQYFVRAIDELKAEGVAVELVMLEGVPNDEIRRVMSECDVVADQLVVGWYAMFALEAMSMGKPVLCFLRPDLLDLYTTAGLVRPSEIPIVNCNPHTVKEAIRSLAENPQAAREIGERGPGFVRDHHSLEYVGGVFDRINRSVGVSPSGSGERV